MEHHVLSRATENTANSEKKKSHCRFCGIQWVVFTDASLLALRSVFPASNWQRHGPFCGDSFRNTMKGKPNFSLDFNLNLSHTTAGDH